MVIISKKKVIGLIEEITFNNGTKYCAKIDTGADSSSIDKNILKKLGDNKSGGSKIIRSALGRHKRETVFLEILFKGKKFRKKFTISDRSKLRYKILIGKDILQKGKFLIDPNK